MQNIEENENTKFIEEYFNCKISEFCDFFTGGEGIKNPKNENELQKMKFMFIDRNVYDFMSSHVGDEYNGKGHLDFGNEGILKLLGFEYVGKNDQNQTYDPKRYNQEWKFGEELFYSDGTWLHHKNGSVYYLDSQDTYGKSSSLSNYITIPEDKMWIGEKSMWQLWKYLDEDKRFEKLSYILDVDYYSYYRFSSLLKTLRKHNREDLVEIPKPESIAHCYLENIDKFGDNLAELVTVRHNLNCMSGYFAPYIQYLTPQCGEFKQHQAILEKFAEINKSYIREEED